MKNSEQIKNRGGFTCRITPFSIGSFFQILWLIVLSPPHNVCQPTMGTSVFWGCLEGLVSVTVHINEGLKGRK